MKGPLDSRTQEIRRKKWNLCHSTKFAHRNFSAKSWSFCFLEKERKERRRKIFFSLFSHLFLSFVLPLYSKRSCWGTHWNRVVLGRTWKLLTFRTFEALTANIFKHHFSLKIELRYTTKIFWNTTYLNHFCTLFWQKFDHCAYLV